MKVGVLLACKPPSERSLGATTTTSDGEKSLSEKRLFFGGYTRQYFVAFELTRVTLAQLCTTYNTKYFVIVVEVPHHRICLLLVVDGLFCA